MQIRAALVCLSSETKGRGQGRSDERKVDIKNWHVPQIVSDTASEELIINSERTSMQGSGIPFPKQKRF